MKIIWSIPVRGERLTSARGDLVRARRLIEALREDGHDVRVVEDAAAGYSDFIISAYRRVVRRALPRKLALLLRDVGRWLHARQHGRRVAAAALRERADVIIETQVHLAGSGALATKLSGIPLILDDCSPSSEEIILGAGWPGLVRRVLRQQIRAASVIVAVSAAARERLMEEGAPAHKVFIIPNGVDLTAYGQGSREAMRQRLGLADRIVLGFVGSFQPWHRVELLVEALALLRNYCRLQVVLVGDGPCRDSVLAASRRLNVSDRVTAVGAVSPSEVPEFLSAFDVGVLPGSNDYGHPMKLLEYAAAGLPSVAPDLPSIRSVIEHGVTGLLFSAGQVNSLAATLAQLVTDEQLRHRLGACARRQIALGASWRDRACSLVSAFKMPILASDCEGEPIGVQTTSLTERGRQ
ncbi:MAG TPA: glycosyltransferase family 4 protein [Blastocatellia bacterium]|nr:glycosyltransferase family 4 protein [Blastocatellia bacterium]